MTDALPLLAVIGAAAAAAWWQRRTARRFRPATPAPVSMADGDPTLVLFTLTGCGPCQQAHAVLDTLARTRGLRLDTVDIAAVPERAAAAGVRRAPTTVLVGPDGDERGRITGIPDPRALTAALGTARATAR